MSDNNDEKKGRWGWRLFTIALYVIGTLFLLAVCYFIFSGFLVVG